MTPRMMCRIFHTGFIMPTLRLDGKLATNIHCVNHHTGGPPCSQTQITIQLRTERAITSDGIGSGKGSETSGNCCVIGITPILDVCPLSCRRAYGKGTGPGRESLARRYLQRADSIIIRGGGCGEM